MANAWHYINQYTIELAGPRGGTDANAWQNLEAGFIMSHKLHSVPTCEQCEHSKAIGLTEVSGSFSPGSHRLSPIWRRYSLPNRVFSMRACFTDCEVCGASHNRHGRLIFQGCASPYGILRARYGSFPEMSHMFEGHATQ